MLGRKEVHSTHLFTRKELILKNGREDKDNDEEEEKEQKEEKGRRRSSRAIAGHCLQCPEILKEQKIAVECHLGFLLKVMTLKNKAEYLGNNSWAPKQNEVTTVLGSYKTMKNPSEDEKKWLQKEICQADEDGFVLTYEE